MAGVLTMEPGRELVTQADATRSARFVSEKQAARSKHRETSLMQPPVRSGMSVMTLAERPRQTRARAPRARTGCKQCKHIKCDEGKPSCQRCLVGGRVCEGLSYSGVAVPPPRPKGSPYETVTDKVRQDELWRLVTSAVPAAVSDNLFRSSKDWDHFQFFIRMGTPYETLPDGSLQLLTPQVAHLVPAVKEVCCAVGALSKTMHLRGEEATEALSDSTDHYGRAAALLRSTKPTNDNLLSVCVASLMFTTYEMLSRKPVEACSHFKYSCLIFQQYLAKRCEESGVSLVDLTLTELETAISDTLQRLSTYPWSRDVEIETPTKQNHLLGCCRGQPYTSVLVAMPTRFNDMREASKWWDASQHFVVHHVDQGRIGGAPEQTMWAQCVDTLHSWHNRFYPLFQRARQDYQNDSAGHADRYLQGLMLETLYLQTLGSISKYHLDDANLLPATKPLYMEMLRVTRRRLPKRENFEDPNLPREKFLLRPLAYVLHECEDEDVAQEAWEMLQEVERPGVITMALKGVLARNEGDKPMASAMLGWTWDFLCAGCSTMASMLEGDSR